MTAYFAPRPRKYKPRIVCFTAHSIVSRTERPAHDHRDLRYHGVRHRVHHFRARFNDAAPLGVASHHEPVYVMKEDKRNQVLIAVHDEARCFLSRLGVDHAAKLDALMALVVRLLRMQLLVGNNPHGESADARVPADQRLAVLRLVFIEAARIDALSPTLPSCRMASRATDHKFRRFLPEQSPALPASFAPTETAAGIPTFQQSIECARDTLRRSARESLPFR